MAKREEVANFLQLALFDNADTRAEHLKLVFRLDESRRALEQAWKSLDLGPLPEYEPEFKVRRVG